MYLAPMPSLFSIPMGTTTTVIWPHTGLTPKVAFPPSTYTMTQIRRSPTTDCLRTSVLQIFPPDIELYVFHLIWRLKAHFLLRDLYASTRNSRRGLRRTPPLRDTPVFPLRCCQIFRNARLCYITPFVRCLLPQSNIARRTRKVELRATRDGVRPGGQSDINWTSMCVQTTAPLS